MLFPGISLTQAGCGAGNERKRATIDEREVEFQHTPSDRMSALDVLNAPGNATKDLYKAAKVQVWDISHDVVQDLLLRTPLHRFPISRRGRRATASAAAGSGAGSLSQLLWL
eukprot:8957691-Pyramimonas_sp.AAC.1